MTRTVSLRAVAVGALSAMLFAASASANDACGLCAKQITINSELASCFLEKYNEIAKAGGDAVAVDLSDCTSRGVVEPLPSPMQAVAQQPDLQFMVSRTQLDCLKKKLEEPGIVLDPSATIDLGSCG
jgi:uncharacterized protein YjaG (DUF416 family)